MACKCYHTERNFLGKIGVCLGTKECEACSCGGDERKCDFYDYVRKRATPKTTNADRVRAMTDEELAQLLRDYECNRCDWCGLCDEEDKCEKEILDWLKQEADNG